MSRNPQSLPKMTGHHLLDGFYSPLARAIELAPGRLEGSRGEIWSQWLVANASRFGVKAQELEWSGILDYLELQGKAALTKEGLAHYLDDSGVKISEVVLSQDAPSGFVARKVANISAGELKNYPGNDFFGPSDWLIFHGSDAYVGSWDGVADSPEEAVDKFRSEEDLSRYGNFAREPRYRQHTFPGGDNYREVLITLPEQSGGIEQWYREVFVPDAKTENSGCEPPSAFAEYGDWEAKNYLADIYVKWAKGNAKPTYISSHWCQANVLVHIRVNDRTDVDGKRVLFIEEIQSDWGQEGREKGFNKWRFAIKSDLAAVAAPGESGYWDVYLKSRTSKAAPHIGVPVEASSDEFAIDKVISWGWKIASNAKGEYLTASELVPPAPFVTNTESWLDLALKRIVMLAVDGGYDRVAFISGEQSADRNDLIICASSVAIDRMRNGTWGVSLKTLRGIPKYRTLKSINDVADWVGKNLADKVKDLPPGESQQFGDLDCKVGGEGMKTFYDQIVPNALNRLLQKIGGEKMAVFSIAGLDATSAPALRIREDGRGEYGVIWAPTGKQPGFDVTPKMREAVAQGLPLFSKVAPIFECIKEGGYDDQIFSCDESEKKCFERNAGSIQIEDVDAANSGFHNRHSLRDRQR